MPYMDSLFLHGADDPRQFPDDVDQAVTRAMLAVISSTCSSSSSSSAAAAAAESMYRLVRVPATCGAFKPYVHQTNFAPNLEGEQALNSPAGQRVIKKGIDILRGVNMAKMELFAQA